MIREDGARMVAFFQNSVAFIVLTSRHLGARLNLMQTSLWHDDLKIRAYLTPSRLTKRVFKTRILGACVASRKIYESFLPDSRVQPEKYYAVFQKNSIKNKRLTSFCEPIKHKPALEHIPQKWAPTLEKLTCQNKILFRMLFRHAQ